MIPIETKVFIRKHVDSINAQYLIFRCFIVNMSVIKQNVVLKYSKVFLNFTIIKPINSITLMIPSLFTLNSICSL